MKSLFAVALGVVLLAGCTPTPEPAPSAAATEQSSSTPTPTPTPTVVVKPRLDELIISPDGLGPIVIGQAFIPRDPATDVLVWDHTFCDFSEDLSPYDYGNWKNSYSDFGYREFLAEVSYENGTTESPIIRISSADPAIRTEDGLGVGSTIDELRAVYGDDLTEYPEEEYYPFVVTGRYGQLVFWFSYETPGQVFSMQVLMAAELPVWSFRLAACA